MNKKWFIRGPQAHVDEIYMTNMIEATQFFMRWYFSVGNFSFRNMLKHMHRIVSRDYQGHTNSNYILKVCNGFRGERNTTWYPILKKCWFTDIPDVKNIRPTLPFIGSEMGHRLENTEEGYVLHLPDSKYVVHYLARMETLMNRIRNNSSKPLDLDVVVAYIQMFVVGHPFEKINFSVCMAQVNAMLYTNGLKPVYHGWFDFECFMYDYRKLVKIFRAKF